MKIQNSKADIMKPNFLTVALAAIAFATALQSSRSAPQAAGAYTITALSMPPAINDAYGNLVLSYDYAYPTSINDQGQIAGTLAVSSDFFVPEGLYSVGHPFLWQTGVMTDLEPLDRPGLPYQLWLRPRHQQRRHRGGSTTIDYRRVAVVWKNGQRFLLEPQETVESSDGLAINQSGHVAGYSAGRAIIWHDGIKTELGGDFIYATGINDADQVCGHTYTADSYRAVVWRNGVVTTLPALGADAGYVAPTPPSGSMPRVRSSAIPLTRTIPIMPLSGTPAR